VASLGQLHWFFGNVYEAAVDMPQLLADAHPNRAPCLLGSGSLLRPCQARCRHRLPQPCARRAGTATWSQSNRKPQTGQDLASRQPGSAWRSSASRDGHCSKAAARAGYI